MDCCPSIKKRGPTQGNRVAWLPSYALFEIVRRWRSESRPLSDITILMVVLFRDGPNVSKSYLELTVNTFVGKCFLLHGKADDLARILILSKAGGTPRRRAQNPPEFFAVSRRT
jgi:hypothetical protein